MSHHDTPNTPLTDDTTTEPPQRVALDPDSYQHAAWLARELIRADGCDPSNLETADFIEEVEIVQRALARMLEQQQTRTGQLSEDAVRLYADAGLLDRGGRRFRLGGTTTAEATASAERAIRRLRDEARHTSLEPLPQPPTLEHGPRFTWTDGATPAAIIDRLLHEAGLPTREELLDQEQRRRLRDLEPGRHRANRPEPPLRDSYRGRHRAEDGGLIFHDLAAVLPGRIQTADGRVTMDADGLRATDQAGHTFHAPADGRSFHYEKPDGSCPLEHDQAGTVQP